METTPYSQSLLYLKRLQEDIYESQLTDRKRQDDQDRQTDINMLCFGQGNCYRGVDENIKKYLVDNGFISIDTSKYNTAMTEITLTSKGEIFINKYGTYLGRLELYAKDYPFLIGASLFGIIGGIISSITIDLVEFLTK